MPTTTRLGLPYPVLADAADGPAAIGALALALDIAAITSQGVFASRPVSTGGSPGKTGRWYYATDTLHLYYDFGTGWFDVTPPSVGADSITAFHIAANAVGSSELADNSVDAAAIINGVITAAKIVAGTITAAEIAAALKPSGGAGAATEALRKLGTAAGEALPGTHWSAVNPVIAVNNGTLTIPTSGITWLVVISGHLEAVTGADNNADVTAACSSGTVLGSNFLTNNISVPSGGGYTVRTSCGAQFKLTTPSAGATISWTGDTSLLTNGVISARPMG